MDKCSLEEEEGRGNLIPPSIVADLIYGTVGQKTTVAEGTSLDLGDTSVKGPLSRSWKFFQVKIL